jgi:Holliday junction DNA helicase RuvB
MNENLDPTNGGYNSEELDLEKRLRPLSLTILLVKIRY